MKESLRPNGQHAGRLIKHSGIEQWPDHRSVFLRKIYVLDSQSASFHSGLQMGVANLKLGDNLAMDLHPNRK